ncbi:MAG: FIST C-terminal domain-containing protein [Gammaproteobacteria bacterium]|nr:MAG: FIST C-terminal domain-containing protein [Gammaproteobacteria bacterium]
MKSTSISAASATGTTWQSIAEHCLADIGQGDTPANLGFLYVTEPLAAQLSSLLAYLRENTGIADWIGSVGSGICCTGREIYDEPAAAVMLATLPDNSYRLIPPGIDSMTDMITANRNWFAEQGVHFGIVHGDPRNSHVQQIIESLSAELNPGFLVGGLSSANDAMNQLQIAGDPCQDGLSGVLMSSGIPVISGLTQGCTPLEKKHTVTHCERNILAELDGRPALDVFREDIGEVLSKDLSKVAGYIFAGLPVSGSDTGDYLVRNLVGIDPDQKLLAIGDYVEEGDSIMFCRRDGETAREDMLRMLHDLGNRAAGKIRGGVYYTCLGRGRHQFGENSEELRMIQDELGDFPLVGFFANGEISHNRLYGYTGVLTLFL